MSTRRSDARPFGYKAARVADETITALESLGDNARGIDRQIVAIDRMAEMGIAALKDGNMVLTREILLDIRNRMATARHAAATMLGTANTASGALAAARMGEYGE